MHTIVHHMIYKQIEQLTIILRRLWVKTRHPSCSHPVNGQTSICWDVNSYPWLLVNADPRPEYMVVGISPIQLLLIIP